ncbi:MAG TPA: DUF58 domain-containing protein [Propionibacteriaceae bacterium]|nr:DUF58 domain-containing protein [Propionibacteriaceae bacterium]
MLVAWTTLTGRGRFFLVLGVAVTVTSSAWGQPDLAWLGVLLVVLPLAAVIQVHRTRLSLGSERRIEPSRAPVGDRLTGTLALTKAGSLPVGLLQFEEAVPAQLGRRPRFSVHQFTGRWQRRITYPLMGLSRGRFRVGPLVVHAADPFGLARLDSTLAGSDEVMITPHVVPLSQLTNAGGSGSAGDTAPQHVGRLGQDDVLVREYRQGDDVRRVHWRSTARWGQVMVRREEQAWEPSATVLLDNRVAHHEGAGREGSFEWAVSAAASVCSHLTGAGYRVALIDASGGVVSGGSEDPVTSREAMLIALTDAALHRTDSLSAAVNASVATREGEIMIAVLGRLTIDDVVSLERIRRARAQGFALALHPESFVGAGLAAGAEQVQAIRQLREQGWRVVEVRAGMTVGGAWERLGQEALV